MTKEIVRSFLIGCKNAEWKKVEVEGLEDEWEYIKVGEIYVLRYNPYGAYHFIEADTIEEAWKKYLEM